MKELFKKAFMDALGYTILLLMLVCGVNFPVIFYILALKVSLWFIIPLIIMIFLDIFVFIALERGADKLIAERKKENL